MASTNCSVNYLNVTENMGYSTRVAYLGLNRPNDVSTVADGHLSLEMSNQASIVTILPRARWLHPLSDGSTLRCRVPCSRSSGCEQIFSLLLRGSKLSKVRCDTVSRIRTSPKTDASQSSSSCVPIRVR